MPVSNPALDHQKRLERYYQWQSKIYDATRWSFLFGRKEGIRQLPFPADASLSGLEVGCGTGFNLELLARRYPQAKLLGLDLSPDMLTHAQKRLQPFGDRIRLEQRPYPLGESQQDSFDFIVFSYALTMINPHWSDLLYQAHADLKPGGYLLAIDFYDTNQQWFKKHMGNHHVRMDGHLEPVLTQLFPTHNKAVKPAYGGIWHYFWFLGQKD